MSTTDSKLEQHRDTEGPARRTYASLEGTRGYVFLGQSQKDGHYAVHVQIGPMGKPSEWRHVGSGKWNSLSALYEEVEP